MWRLFATLTPLPSLPSASRRGGKSASLSVNGKPLRLTLRNCTTPFEVSSYDRVSDRKSLDLRADSHTIAFMDRLDTELKKYAVFSLLHLS